MTQTKKILLSGGGSLGPIVPLFNIQLSLKDLDYEFMWVVTPNGPELDYLKSQYVKHDLGKLNYKLLKVVKLRRYLSVKNIKDLIISPLVLKDARKIIKEYQPDLHITAGGFTSVPLVYVSNKVKLWVHQQDVQIGLANKLMMNKADKITSVLDLRDVGSDQIGYISSGVQLDKNYDIYKQYPNLKKNIKTLLITGGGSGSIDLNKFANSILKEVNNDTQIIHITGKNKTNNQKKENYTQIEYVADHMLELLDYSSLVVSRAGISTLSELSLLSKPAVLIPLKGHQELNAKHIVDKDAAIMVQYNELNSESASKILTTLNNDILLSKLSSNISGIIPSSDKKIIQKIVSKLI